MKALLVAAFAAITLAGCSVPKAEVAADPALSQAGAIVLRGAIRHGVNDYLDQHPGYAARAKALVDDLLLVVNSEAQTTLAALKELAYSKIPAEFSPMDREDSKSLIDFVALAVGQHVDGGRLDGKALVDLRDVLGTISYIAGQYVKPTG